MDNTIPEFIVDLENKIELNIPQTQAQISDQGYTYNQAGFTYDQIGVNYGGIYNNNEDIIPIELSFSDY